MALTRMILAIQMTDTKATRLRVSGDVGSPPPAMTSLRREDSATSSVDQVGGSWTMDLDAGDYLIEIQVENWLAGRLDIAPELTPGQSPPAFVYHGPLPGIPAPGGLAAWTAPVLYIDPPVSSAVGDPKDPLPPPPPPPESPPPWVTLAPISAAWFAAELIAARARIAGQLLMVGGKSMPADVLDGLATEL